MFLKQCFVYLGFIQKKKRTDTDIMLRKNKLRDGKFAVSNDVRCKSPNKCCCQLSFLQFSTFDKARTAVSRFLFANLCTFIPY